VRAQTVSSASAIIAKLCEHPKTPVSTNHQKPTRVSPYSLVTEGETLLVALTIRIPTLFFKSGDPNVNYFNPYVLVCRRHNHDMKCILSGKAAKAATFYISDHITQMNMACSGEDARCSSLIYGNQ